MAIAFVQKAVGSGTATSSITTAAFASNTTAGNTLVVVVVGTNVTGSNTGPSASAFTVTDSKGNTAAFAFGHELTAGVPTNVVDVCVYFIPITTGGSAHTVTTAYTSGPGLIESVAFEVSGLGATSLDIGGFAAAANSSTTMAPTLTSTNANDLIIACMGAVNGGAGMAITDPPAGFSSLKVQNSGTANAGMEAAYQIASSAGAFTSTWTYTASATGWYSSVIVALKGPAASTSIIQSLFYQSKSLYPI